MTTETYIAAGGQRIRVRVEAGRAACGAPDSHSSAPVPLVVCNGIGASMEVLDPFVDALDPALTVIRFDVPGTGGSPTSLLPYRFPYLAWVLGRVLDKLGYSVVDILGMSWGGALAQQFAFQNPRRCRRLVLVATGTGMLMVPGSPHVLSKMLTPRRFSDPDYAATIARELYGGAVRRHEGDVAELFRGQLRAGSTMGYLHQLFAGLGWSSLPALWAIRQETLIVAGDDDPIIPIANAHIMNALLPHSYTHIHPGGHIDLVMSADRIAPVVSEFLAAAVPGETTRSPR